MSYSLNSYLVSPSITPMVVLYIIPHVAPFKELDYSSYGDDEEIMAFWGSVGILKDSLA